MLVSRFAENFNKVVFLAALFFFVFPYVKEQSQRSDWSWGAFTLAILLSAMFMVGIVAFTLTRGALRLILLGFSIAVVALVFAPMFYNTIWNNWENTLRSFLIGLAIGIIVLSVVQEWWPGLEYKGLHLLGLILVLLGWFVIALPDYVDHYNVGGSTWYTMLWASLITLIVVTSVYAFTSGRMRGIPMIFFIAALLLLLFAPTVVNGSYQGIVLQWFGYLKDNWSDHKDDILKGVLYTVILSTAWLDFFSTAKLAERFRGAFAG